MTKHRSRWSAATVAAFAVATLGACSGTSSASLCDDRDRIADALGVVVDGGPGAGANLRRAAEVLADTVAPDDLVDDLGLLVDYLDVVIDVSNADLENPDTVADIDARLAVLEARLDDARLAAQRVRQALDDCDASTGDSDGPAK